MSFINVYEDIKNMDEETLNEFNELLEIAFNEGRNDVLQAINESYVDNNSKESVKRLKDKIVIRINKIKGKLEEAKENNLNVDTALDKSIDILNILLNSGRAVTMYQLLAVAEALYQAEHTGKIDTTAKISLVTTSLLSAYNLLVNYRNYRKITKNKK